MEKPKVDKSKVDDKARVNDGPKPKKVSKP